jgi:DNA-binding transcriptional LysR family regulator
MTPTQLRAYAAIVRLGASKAAAAELGVSEAAVSAHVAALRRELDDVLFERSSLGLSFTPGGLRLATRAVEMLGLQDQTRHEVRSAAAGRRVLRLAVSSLFGEYAAPGLIELFSTRAKDLSVEMSVHAPGEFGPLLVSRGADVAIGPRPSNLPDGLEAKEFLRYQLAVVAGAGHVLANRRATPAELAGSTWLLGPSVLDQHGVAVKMLRRFKVPEGNQRIFQSHAAALTEARRAGLALAPVQHVAADLTEGRLVRVEAMGCQADGVWSVFTLGRDRTPPTAAELVRFVSTPRAIQAMLGGSGANITHFRPSVHVTLWS